MKAEGGSGALRGYVETYRGVVMSHDVDALGHMGVSSYMDKFTHALGQLYGRCGFPLSSMRESGEVFVAVEQTIRYHKELRLLHLVTIESAFVSIREKSVRLRHRMVDSVTGTVYATLEQVNVLFSMGQRRSVAISPALRAQIQTYLVKECS